MGQKQKSMDYVSFPCPTLLFRGKKMNTLLGTIITALVADENDKFYFVQKDGVTFALSKEEGEHAIGDMVTGFAYTDSKQKSRLTQKEIQRPLVIPMIGEKLLKSARIWVFL